MRVLTSDAGRGLAINPHKGKRYANPPAGFVQRALFHALRDRVLPPSSSAARRAKKPSSISDLDLRTRKRDRQVLSRGAWGAQSLDLGRGELLPRPKG
jgi:hypothetical protein